VIAPLAERLRAAWADPRGLGAHLDVDGNGPVDHRDADILERHATKLGPLASFAAKHARMSEVLGTAVRGDEAAQAIHFDLGRRDRVTSDQLIRALERIDVGALRSRGIAPAAVFDFDDTLMHGDVIFEFAELAVAKKMFLPTGNALLVERLLAELPPERDPETARRRLLERPVHENVKLTLKLVEAKKARPHALFNVLSAALAGRTPDEVKAVARELFERGAPGRAPYRTHLFSRDVEKSSAKDLVETLSSRGIDCWIVTAGLGLIAEVGAEYAGVSPERVLGAELLLDAEGKITGEVIDMFDFGKDRALLEKIGVPPLFAFGDNPRSDGPMLRLATVRGVIVGDRPAFKALDEQHALGHLELQYSP
jgi:phosphoserine phosphatase